MSYYLKLVSPKLNKYISYLNGRKFGGLMLLLLDIYNVFNYRLIEMDKEEKGVVIKTLIHNLTQIYSNPYGDYIPLSSVEPLIELLYAAHSKVVHDEYIHYKTLRDEINRQLFNHVFNALKGKTQDKRELCQEIEDVEDYTKDRLGHYLHMLTNKPNGKWKSTRFNKMIILAKKDFNISESIACC